MEVAVLEGVSQFGPKFLVEEEVPTNHSSCRKTKCIDLSYGIRIWAEIYFALLPVTRLTDRQTDRLSAHRKTAAA